MLTLLRLLVALAGSSPDMTREQALASMAPSVAGADETPDPDRTKFKDCESVVQSLADRGGGHIAERTYWLSPKWGHLLRARLVTPIAGADATTLVTCWFHTGQDIQISVDASGSGR